MTTLGWKCIILQDEKWIAHPYKLIFFFFLEAGVDVIVCLTYEYGIAIGSTPGDLVYTVDGAIERNGISEFGIDGLVFLRCF